MTCARADAFRVDSGRGRQNSFAGLVLFFRRCCRTTGCAPGETRRGNKRFLAQADSCRPRPESTRNAGAERWSGGGCVRMGLSVGLSGRNFRSCRRSFPRWRESVPRLRLKRIVPVSNRPFYSKIPRPKGWGACISFPGPPRRGSRIPGRPGGEGCGGPGYGSPWS